MLYYVTPHDITRLSLSHVDISLRSALVASTSIVDNGSIRSRAVIRRWRHRTSVIASLSSKVSLNSKVRNTTEQELELAVCGAGNVLWNFCV